MCILKGELEKEIKDTKNKLIKIILKNKYEFIISPNKVKMFEEDKLIIIVEKNKFKNTIYKFLGDEIIGIEIYQN